MNTLIKRSVLLPTLLMVLLSLSGCLAQVQEVQTCIGGDPVGFWEGLWHGFIAPVTFVISLFSDSITVFELNNNGTWYLFGFLLGVGAFTKGGSAGAKRARRRRD